ncbi:SDR family oxidoreductase [Caulobacter sp. NIBR1757]|uniref:SDR family oxidoreductase n=1 Tax=Caulobacter sp. NIBR1757 TaxID=3016000 RepID=UPI0022F02C32|nr:SDR family oxidoreductase [Caulobacter sp. NIBR1757]WGM37492.1 General stress protein 39 [Caulobacter sp. NIBR1757]
MRGVALVTGAARRIGRGLALAAAGAGYDLAIHHRSHPEDADSLAQEAAALGVNCLTLTGDLADPVTASALLDAAGRLGPVTLLINNASLFEDDSLNSLNANGLNAHLAVNLTAPVLLSQAFALRLPRGTNGLIVNILDQRVLRPNPQFFSYSLSKAALWSATRTMAQALAPHIRVNGIGPGPTLPSVHQVPGEFEAEVAGTLLGKPVDPDEIAAALRYLIDAPSVTGQMIAVDAGQHLGWRTPDIVSG